MQLGFVMDCKIDGCERKADYKAKQVCQKHYFRFMRYGTYELTAKPAKYRTSNPAGYQVLREPDHPLADKGGRVYEHRFVYYNEIGDVSSCAMCDKSISWSDCHIDHIDCDVTNNCIDNLRATCRSCNTVRGHSPNSMGKHMITINGVTMAANCWARVDGVAVTGATIINRKKRGMTDYDAVFSERVTHKSKNNKKVDRRYDDVRGILKKQLETMA